MQKIFASMGVGKKDAGGLGVEAPCRGSGTPGDRALAEGSGKKILDKGGGPLYNAHINR